MASLQTFDLPEAITGTESDVHLGRQLVHVWQTDGIFQVATDIEQDQTIRTAIDASRRFFSLPLAKKTEHVSDLAYSGYIASGEEVTAGEADYSEIFTVCKDLPETDPRVQAKWPCHGPTPWPDGATRRAGPRSWPSSVRSVRSCCGSPRWALGSPTLTRLPR